MATQGIAQICLSKCIECKTNIIQVFFNNEYVDRKISIKRPYINANEVQLYFCRWETYLYSSSLTKIYVHILDIDWADRCPCYETL